MFQDETDLMLFPPLRSGWTKRGQPAAVEISGVNAKRVVFGTISLTGHRLMLVRPKQRSIDFQEFLKLVHSHYCHRQILMILDSDSSHTAKASRQLADELNIMLAWLPARCPELNAVEELWGDAKDVVCANHQFPDIETQTQVFVEYLEHHSNHQARRKAGLLSDNFWLFQ